MSVKHARICFLTESFYPVVGGGESVQKLLAKNLVKINSIAIVVTRRRYREFPKEEMLDGFQVFRVVPWGYKRLGKYLMMCPAFWKLIEQRENFDVIYVCGLRTLGFVAVLAGRLLGKKVVLRSESCGELLAPDFRSRNPFFDSFLKLLIRARNIVLKKADNFVAISRAIVKEYQDAKIAPSKIREICNGIESDVFCPVDLYLKNKKRNGLGIDPSKKVFVYTGKLNQGKGLQLLLDAFWEASEANGNLLLILVGSGAGQFLSCEKELKRFVEQKDLQQKVLFTGYTEEVANYLQLSDCFILPSESEAFGLSLVEALSCGLIAIGTRTGGMVDILENEKNGFLMDVGDRKRLVELMLYVAKNTESNEMQEIRKQARNSVLENYSIRSIAYKHQEFFDGIVNVD